MIKIHQEILNSSKETIWFSKSKAVSEMVAATFQILL